MELISMFKIILKHLKKYYIAYFSFWIVISCLLFIPFNNLNKINEIVLYIFTISTIIFNIYIGITLYSGYGKTFALIQNNRRHFIINALIIAGANTLLLTLLSALLRLNCNKTGLVAFNLQMGIILFSFYLFVFYCGALYGLFINQKKKVRKIFLTSCTIIILICGFYLLPLFYNFLKSLTSFVSFDSFNLYLWIFIIFNIIAIITISIYYLYLNISKTFVNQD